MREIRTSGSEGGAGRKPRSYLYRGGVPLTAEVHEMTLVEAAGSLAIQGHRRS